MEEVLGAIGFEPVHRSGPQWYGRCPLHDTSNDRRGSFSVNVLLGRYTCHRCHSHGNQLDLWAAFINQPMHPATIDLCRVLGREVPWIHRW